MNQKSQIFLINKIGFNSLFFVVKIQFTFLLALQNELLWGQYDIRSEVIMLNYLAIGYKNNDQLSQLSLIITMQVRP